MNKEVMVCVQGIQFEIEPGEPVELITAGNYYNQNGKHYIFYDEADREDGLTKNRIKIAPDKIEVVKSGAANAQMIFEEGKTNLTYYDTAIGNLFLGVTTDSIRVKEEQERISARIRYSLEINYHHISNCEIVIDVKERRHEYES